ncbi:hypothetical protein F511_33202 [Dorcoceras hygrometricum]|uniref:Uncharacterized protein n=1 Tax=Dorcoceras hygrometricum TaxID=472368 RepID=A0A2Z7CDJ9_9LAMI|nr:hypothetical protein F511_33202 [Dorcoceras hygrometricum]
MPPRRVRRSKRHKPIESEAQNDEGEHSIPVRRRARQVDDEVDMLAARVDEMELILARFLCMNPQTFNGPRPEGRILRQPALEGLMRSARTDSPRKVVRSNSDEGRRRVAGTAAAAAWRGGRRPRCARVRSCEL